jgi:hypothetical protein
MKHNEYKEHEPAFIHAPLMILIVYLELQLRYLVLMWTTLDQRVGTFHDALCMAD